jgi:hypothetical protein
VFLHGKKGIGKKDRKWWHCDNIFVHLKEFAPNQVWWMPMYSWWKSFGASKFTLRKCTYDVNAHTQGNWTITFTCIDLYNQYMHAPIQPTQAINMQKKHNNRKYSHPHTPKVTWPNPAPLQNTNDRYLVPNLQGPRTLNKIQIVATNLLPWKLMQVTLVTYNHRKLEPHNNHLAFCKN